MGGLNAIFQANDVREKDLAKRNSSGRNRGWSCSEADLKTGLDKVQHLIIEKKLYTRSTIQIIGKTKGSDGATGTDKAAVSSIDRYEIYWKTVRDFCFFVGDYQSAIIFCRDQCPLNPYPMNIETCIHCLRFLVWKKGTPLKHYRTNEIVKDRQNNPITCQGVWTGESTVKGYRSALSKLFSHYNTTKGDYIEPCLACVEAECSVHDSDPHTKLIGCVTKSQSFKNHIALTLDYVETEYNGKATFALLPVHMRLLRMACISSNDLYSLMVWTMMIVAVKLFARIDEVIMLQVEDFSKDHFVVTEHDVTALCAKLQGKCDKEVMFMAIWDDEDCPEFSASRALLIWMAVSGIQSGYVFPSRQTVQSRDKHPKAPVSYTTILSHTKNVVANVCNVWEDDSTILGTHLFRKTMYGFAGWDYYVRGNKFDGYEASSLSQSARHAEVQSTVAYVRDSQTLITLKHKLSPHDPENKVGKFQPIHIKTHKHWHQLKKGVADNAKPLPELAEWYFAKLGLSPNDVIGQIYNKVCGFRAKRNAENRFNEIVAALSCSSELKAEVLELFHENASEKKRKALVVATKAAEQGADGAPAAKASRVSDKEPMKLSRDFKELFVAEKNREKKIRILLEVFDEVDGQRKEGKDFIDGGFRRWMGRTAKVVSCVRNCHNGNVVSFVEEEDGFTHSRFARCKRCNAK